ncbi:MAG: T9SS type A sorting domain-containing protein, partial [Bacteroidia bacterium]
QLCAATNSGYLWSTGSTTQCITVSTGGTYTVTVANADGCTSSCSKTVTAFTLPTCSITGSNFCQGGSSQLCAATNSGYLWSTGSTTQCITVSTGGTYTVTVANANGCTSSCSKTVTAFTLPTCSITGSNFCQGGSSQLCAATNSGYLWSTGSTTQCITVSTGGTYTVTVSNADGCTSSCSKTVTAFTLPTCSITGGNFCQGGTSQLCAATNSSYLWSTGSTTQCITVSIGGTYTVTVSNADACTSSCSKTVTAFTFPTCSITGSNFCQGGTSQLCAATNSSYLWSSGSTTQCITVSTGGTYTVTVTNANGCINSCSKTVTAFTLPTCSITGSNFCQGGTSQLCAATNSSYLWSTGSTTQCITVSTGGTYTVTAANANGCTISCSKTVTAFTLPTCSITGSNFCQGGSTQLCAATNSGYLWSTGSTTQCITVTTGGTYTVTVSNANGCTSSCSKTVTAFTLPTCSITGSNFCQGGSSQLCAATNSSYLWSTGSTTQCIIVSTGGTYTVTVVNSSGCTSSCSKTVTAFTLPTCSITGSNFCQGGSSQLCAATNSGYLWSTGTTTQCITISTGGTYTVTVNSADGCTSSCSKVIIVYQLPSCAITGNIAYCQGSTTQLCGPTGMSAYLWSTGATTQCIAAGGGDYTVTATNADGCTSSCSITTHLRLLPVCAITGNNFCNGSSSQLCAATAPIGYVYSYAWSAGATTQCITVLTGGTYTVNITNQYGCTSSCSKTVTAYALPTCSITGSSSICQGNSTQLCAPTNSSYLWNTGATTQCITVTTNGTYRVTVTNANGCTSSCSKVITVKALPNCSITGNSSVCEGSSAQWCAPGGLAAYLWSEGKTTKCISVNTAGTYTITVTNTNGCTSSCSKALTVNPLPATFAITGKSAICQGSSAQLCAPAGYSSYIWSTAKTTQCVTENSAATYTVTVTNSNGCTRKQSKKLTVNPLPSCAITGNTVIKSGTTTNLCVAIVAGNTYHWNTGATSNCITVSTAGNYTVTVTNNKGCTSSCSVHVTVEIAREGIDDGSANVAGNIEAKAFPNPFHSSTTIEFKNNNNDAHITVEIFNITGEKIAVLFDGDMSAGEVREVKFDAANLGDGVYFYRITSGEAVLNGRVVLIRE